MTANGQDLLPLGTLQASEKDLLSCGTPQAVISYDKLDTFMLCTLDNVVSNLHKISFVPTKDD